MSDQPHTEALEAWLTKHAIAPADPRVAMLRIIAQRLDLSEMLAGYEVAQLAREQRAAMKDLLEEGGDGDGTTAKAAYEAHATTWLVAVSERPETKEGDPDE